ncbi:MAG: hypothetical protein V1820_04820 [archaeon]
MAEQNPPAPFFIIPPVRICDFPDVRLLAPFVAADFFSRIFGGQAVCATISDCPEATAAFNSIREARFPVREKFSKEALPDDLPLIDSMEKFSKYFLGKLEDALTQLSASSCSRVSSESPLGKSVAEYFLRETRLAGISAEGKPFQPFCPECEVFLPSFGKISRKFFALFQTGEFHLAVGLEKPEELFSASAISVDPESFLEISGKILSAKGDFPGSFSRSPAADFVGASAKNPLTEEFVPILPGEKLGIVSPGTRESDLKFLKNFPEETASKWDLSRKKLEEIQVKFPVRAGLFTEACGSFFGFPVEDGRRAILAEISKRGALLEVPKASGKCFCGCALVPRETTGDFFLPSNSRIQEKPQAYLGRENAHFTFQAIASERLSTQILPLFSGFPEAKNPEAYSYLLGNEKNFNLVWKGSGYSREELLSAGKIVSDRFSHATLVCRSFREAQEFFLASLAFEPLGRIPDIFQISSRAGSGPAPGPALAFSAALRSGLAEEIRLAILTGNLNPDEKALLRLKRTISKFKLEALRISSLPEAATERRRGVLSAAYSRRKVDFLSAAGRRSIPEAVSQAFLFLSDFREFARSNGQKSEGLEVFRSFAKEILAPLLPKTSEEILSNLRDIVITSPEPDSIGPSEEKPEQLEKILLSREIVETLLSDSRKLVELAGKPKEMKIYLAEEWKYRLFRNIFEFGVKPGPNDPIFQRLGVSLRPEELEKFLLTLRKTRFDREFLSLDEEARAISGAISLISAETGVKTVQVLVNREIPFEKMLRARPGKPAIFFD